MTNHKLLKGADFGLLFFVYFIWVGKRQISDKFPTKQGTNWGRKGETIYV